MSQDTEVDMVTPTEWQKAFKNSKTCLRTGRAVVWLTGMQQQKCQTNIPDIKLY